MQKKNRLKFIILLILSIIWLFPLVAIFVFSFAPNEDILKMNLIPSSYTLENYITVFTTQISGVSIPSSLINSFIVVVIQVFGILILDTPAAYALARFKFRGRDIIFYTILLAMMMPGHIILISLYTFISRCGLVDTLPGVFLPGLARVIGIFLLRQFFKQIPQEIEEAAIIDGANRWQIFIQIMIPITIPALTTLTVITVLYSWNNFLWPLIVTNSPATMTVPISLAYLNASAYAAQNLSTLLASSFVACFPMILFFLIAQKWIVKGIAPTSGIKQ